MDTDQHGTVGSGWFRVSGWSMEPSWPSWCLGSDVFPRLGALRSAASDESETTGGRDAWSCPCWSVSLAANRIVFTIINNIICGDGAVGKCFWGLPHPCACMKIIPQPWLYYALLFSGMFLPRHGETHHLYMISIDIPWKPILSTHLQQPQLKCY